MLRPRLQEASHSGAALQVPQVGLHRAQRQRRRPVLPQGVLQGAHFDGIAQGLKRNMTRVRPSYRMYILLFASHGVTA